MRGRIFCSKCVYRCEDRATVVIPNRITFFKISTDIYGLKESSMRGSYSKDPKYYIKSGKKKKKKKEAICCIIKSADRKSKFRGLPLP